MDSATSYRTRGGLTVHRHVEPADPVLDVATLVEALDERRGALYSSSYEYPGRYTRWDIGFVDPPLVLTTAGAGLPPSTRSTPGVTCCSTRSPEPSPLRALDAVDGGASERTRPRVRRPGRVGSAPAERRFEEEERSRQPSVFSSSGC